MGSSPNMQVRLTGNICVAKCCLIMDSVSVTRGGRSGMRVLTVDVELFVDIIWRNVYH